MTYNRNTELYFYVFKQIVRSCVNARIGSESFIMHFIWISKRLISTSIDPGFDKLKAAIDEKKARKLKRGRVKCSIRITLECIHLW